MSLIECRADPVTFAALCRREHCMSFHPAHHSNAKLVALHPDVRPEECSLSRDICTIGRAPTCDIVIAQTQTLISRIHARIERQGAHFVLLDAGSANGTFVNGRQIFEAHELRNQDQIGLANPQALLRFNDLEATDLSPRQLQYLRREQRFVFKGVPLDLSPNLTRLLMHLYTSVGAVCTHSSCVQAIWDDAEYDPERLALLYKEVNELREKFRAIDPKCDMIKSRRSVGYYLDISQW